MNISEKTIKALQEVINGDFENAIYRSGPMLVDFFNEFGCNDVYGQGFPSRWDYTRKSIRKFNGTKTLKNIIESTVDPRDYITPKKEVLPWDTSPAPSKISLEKTIDYLNEFLSFDGYALKKEDGKNTYKVFHSDGGIVPGEKLSLLSHEFIKDQIRKSEDKLSQGDYDGAITNCYTLVEEMMKELLRKKNSTFKQDDGDIRNLYKQLSEVLSLNPKGENIESYLKSILEGLRQQIAGLFSLANKASDRHARKYKPSRHHAKLAVNVAFTFCEFLLDSYEYQQNQKTQKEQEVA